MKSLRRGTRCLWNQNIFKLANLSLISNNKNSQQIDMKNCLFSIPCQDSNTYPWYCKSLPFTTSPGLPPLPFSTEFYHSTYLFLIGSIPWQVFKIISPMRTETKSTCLLVTILKWFLKNFQINQLSPIRVFLSQNLSVLVCCFNCYSHAPLVSQCRNKS